MSTRTVETVGEFAEYIKETEIEGAKELFEAYAGKLGMLWERFSTQCITPYSLRNLMNSISRFVSITPFRDIKPLWRVALKPFLAEIEAKALECGKWDYSPLGED